MRGGTIESESTDPGWLVATLPTEERQAGAPAPGRRALHWLPQGPFPGPTVLASLRCLG